MDDRMTLIARKETVRRQLEALRRELARAEARPMQSPRRIDQLQRDIERLMAEEFNLRLAIDRSSSR